MNNLSKKITAQLLLCSLLLESCYNPNLGASKKNLPAPAPPTYQQHQYEQGAHDKPTSLSLTTTDDHPPVKCTYSPTQAAVRSQDQAPATTQPLPRPRSASPRQQRVQHNYKHDRQLSSTKTPCFEEQNTGSQTVQGASSASEVFASAAWQRRLDAETAQASIKGLLELLFSSPSGHNDADYAQSTVEEEIRQMQAETEEFLKRMKETARREALAQAKQEEEQRKIAEEREKAIDRRLANRTGASSNRRRSYFIPDFATDGVEIIKECIELLQEKLIAIPIAAPLPEEQQEAIRSILRQLAEEQQEHRAMYADIQHSLAQLDEELYKAADVQLAEQLLAELEELKKEVVAILAARGEQLAAYEPVSNRAETAAYQELAKALSNPANVEAIASNSQEQMRALLNKRSHQGNSSALSTAAKELAAVMEEVVELLNDQYRAIEDLYLSPAYFSPGARAYLNQDIAEDVHQLKRLRSAIKDIEQSLINLYGKFGLPVPYLISSLPTSQAAQQAAIQTILSSIPVRGSELIQSDRFLEGISNAWKNMFKQADG